jgi:hypothetical protein
VKIAAVVVMRAFRGLRLPLCDANALLRLAEIARLQRIADLADGLGKRAAVLAG